MYAKSHDITGYTYRADIYCPACVIVALPTGPGQEFDGWSVAPGVRMTAEENLTELAVHFSVDRMDENTFDSDYFPKVIFRDMCSWGERDYCGMCGDEIG